MNTDTGDFSEERLGHKEQAEQFYQDLRTRGPTVRVGMEASGHARWFERLLNQIEGDERPHCLRIQLGRVSAISGLCR